MGEKCGGCRKVGGGDKGVRSGVWESVGEGVGKCVGMWVR